MISDTKLQKVLNFTPHEKQQEILDSPARLKVVCAGRRGGKTKIAAYIATKKLLEDNQVVWIVAPDFSLTQILFDEVLQNIGKIFGDEGWKMRRKPHPIIELENGSKLECRSVENPRGMLGRATDLIIMDEAATVEREIWRQYLQPTTLDRKGKAIMISTPRGMNWFYDIWLWAGEDKRRGRFHFTSLDNPEFPKEEWTSLKENTPQKTFEQEYEAKFVSSSGSVFQGIEEIIGDGEQSPKPEASYVVGVDLAKSEDFTVLVVMDRVKREMVYMDRFNGIDYNIQKQRILSLAKKYNCAKVVIDSSGKGDPIADDISRETFTEKYSMHSMKAKQQLIEKLDIFIQQKLITIIPDETLINELRRYGYQESAQGKKYHAPKGSHDDCVIALALAVWSLRPNDYEPDDRPRIPKTFNEYR